MPADHRDLENKERPPPPPLPPKNIIPSVTVTSDTNSTSSYRRPGSVSDIQHQNNDHDYETEDSQRSQGVGGSARDRLLEYDKDLPDYEHCERPDGLSEQLSEKLSALLIKQLSGGPESGVECECGALEDWSSDEGSASMAEDEVLFDEVYAVHEIIGKWVSFILRFKYMC